MRHDAHTERIIAEAAIDQLTKWGVANPTPQQIEAAKDIVCNPSYRPK